MNDGEEARGEGCGGRATDMHVQLAANPAGTSTTAHFTSSSHPPTRPPSYRFGTAVRPSHKPSEDKIH